MPGDVASGTRAPCRRLPASLEPLGTPFSGVLHWRGCCQLRALQSSLPVARISAKGACVPVRFLWFYVGRASCLSSLWEGLGRPGLGLCPGGRRGPGRTEGPRDTAGPRAPTLTPLHGPQHLQLVRQEMAVCPEQLSEFVDSLRQYLRGTAGAGSCFQ